MNIPTKDLYAETVYPDGGGWSMGAWTVAMLSPNHDQSNLGDHENYHQNLNDLTVFGLLLQSLAAEIQAKPNDQHLVALMKHMISSCRLTHESAATFLSLCRDDALESSADLNDNTEYRNYFELGKTLAQRLPTIRLGKCAMNGIPRIAMNAPPPEHLFSDGWAAMKGSDFRASDSPDIRFLRLLEWLDQDFWDATVQRLSDYFGRHPQWPMLLDDKLNPRDADLSKLTPLEVAQWLLKKEHIDSKFVGDVTNFMIDQALLKCSSSGMITLSLAERVTTETRLRMSLKQTFVRSNDSPDDLLRVFRRPFHLERVQFRVQPLLAVLKPEAEMSNDDWLDYAAIIKEEGVLHAYIRTTERLVNTHNWELAPQIQTDVVCFLRKKRYLPDKQIGVHIDHFDKSRKIVPLAIAVSSSGGRLCVQVAASIFSKKEDEFGEWLSELTTEDYLTILLDDDLKHVQRWLPIEGPLAWHIAKFGVNEVPILLLIPLNEQERKRIGLFRPGTMETLLATVRLFEESSNPIYPLASVILGAPIEGIELPKDKESIQIPEELKWNVSRFITEEFNFVPHPATLLDQ